MDNGRTPQIISLLSPPRSLISGNAAPAHANIKTAIWGGAALLASMGRAKNKQIKENISKSENGISQMASQKGDELNWLDANIKRAIWRGTALLASMGRRKSQQMKRAKATNNGKKGAFWMCCQRKGRVEWALKERDGFNGFSKKGTSLIGSQRKGRVEWIL